MSALQLSSLTKRFPDGTVAVDDLSLEIHDGEFLVLVGPSGCGKSTTLRMIAGLEEITDGEVRIGDRVVNHVPPKDRNISMVFQNYALYPHMNVRKNLSFGLELRYGGGLIGRTVRRLLRPAKARELNQKRKEITPRVQQAAELLKIPHLLSRMPKQLSGGERQRVALGRAIVREPEVFLFDEPLSNLDAKLRVEMRRELKQLHARLATTMIYVTHDQVEAMTLGDRVAVMHEGRLQQVGPPLELYDRPANRFVASFMGSPSMNLLDCVVTDESRLRIVGEGSEIQCNLPATLSSQLVGRIGETVAIGIRPEDVSLTEPTGEAIQLRGEVTLIEALGDAMLATVNLLGDGDSNSPAVGQIVAKLDRSVPVAVGEQRPVVLAASRLHLFAESGAGL